MTFTQFTDTQKKALTVIETALAKTRKSMLGTGVSFDMSGLHEGYLGKYNAAASKYIPEADLREEWDKQSQAWRTRLDEKAPNYFPGWVLANRREQIQTANELCSTMTRGHSYQITHDDVDGPSQASTVKPFSTKASKSSPPTEIKSDPSDEGIRGRRRKRW